MAAPKKKYVRVLNRMYRPLRIGKPAGDTFLKLNLIQVGANSLLDVPPGFSSGPIEKSVWGIMVRGNRALQALVEEKKIEVVAHQEGSVTVYQTEARSSNLILPDSLDNPVAVGDADPQKSKFSEDPVGSVDPQDVLNAEPYEMPSLS